VQLIQDGQEYREGGAEKSDLQLCIICLSIERECVHHFKLGKRHNDPKVRAGENDWIESPSLVRK